MQFPSEQMAIWSVGSALNTDSAFASEVALPKNCHHVLYHIMWRLSEIFYDVAHLKRWWIPLKGKITSVRLYNLLMGVHFASRCAPQCACKRGIFYSVRWRSASSTNLFKCAMVTNFTKSGETGVDQTTASTSLVGVVRQISTLSHKPCVPNSILKIRHTVVVLTFMSMIFVLTRNTKNIHKIIPPCLKI